MSIGFFVFLRFFETANTLFIDFCGWGVNPGAKAPGKPPPGRLQAGYAVGEETRMETGPHDSRSARGHDPAPHRRQAAPPTAQAGSPGEVEDTPRPRQQDRPTARHSAHSAPAADAPTQRPTTAPTPSKTPQDTASASLLLYSITADSPPGRSPTAHAGQVDQ